MRNILYFLILNLGFLSCKKESKLEGVWYAAYYKTEEGKTKVYEKMLWDFSDKSMYFVQFGDLSTGDNSKLIVDSSNYEFNGTTLTLNDGTWNLNYHRDSITVSPLGINKTLVLKRASKEFKNINPKPIQTKGSYIIYGKSYRDSLSLINDSILIYTGQFHRNSPVYKWGIINYKGFAFFNIHDPMYPMALIKSWSENEALIRFTPNDYDHKIIASTNIDKSELLIGDWLEFQETDSLNTLPGEIWKQENPFSLSFKKETINISRFGKDLSLNWDLTSDSKRIYFLDKIMMEDGSWKILKLSENKLTISMSINQGASEKIIQFRRKNGR